MSLGKRRLRTVVHIAVAIQILLWLGVIIYTAQHSNPMGDGMEWVVISPATLVLAIGTLPALRLRNSTRLLQVAVLLALIGIALGVGLFFEIVRETVEAGAQ